MLNLLHDVPVFMHLDKSVLEEISERLKSVKLKSHQELFHKGDQGESMFIIAKGKVKVHDDNYVFAVLSEKKVLGEYAILDKMERSASVTAIENSTLLELMKKDFDLIVSRKPQVKENILKMFIKRLREHNKWEEELAYRNLKIEEQKNKIEKQNSKLLKLNTEIKAQKNLKDKLFSIISHDLKGPVSSMQSVSDIIKFYIENNRLDDLKEMSDEISQSVSQLSSLLDNLLKWSLQQQNEVHYHPEEISIYKMMNRLQNIFKMTASSKKIKIVNEVKKDIHVWADKNTIETVFRNLVHNALKFTNEGDTIYLKSNITDSNIAIYVEDTGIGIPEKKLKTLFTLHKTESTFGTKQEKGIGLGLQLVQEFTKLNKGTVKVTSEEGKGTSFEVILPKINV